jgi:hypothetical protein
MSQENMDDRLVVDFGLGINDIESYLNSWQRQVFVTTFLVELPKKLNAKSITWRGNHGTCNQVHRKSFFVLCFDT